MPHICIYMRFAICLANLISHNPLLHCPTDATCIYTSATSLVPNVQRYDRLSLSFSFTLHDRPESYTPFLIACVSIAFNRSPRQHATWLSWQPITMTSSLDLPFTTTWTRWSCQTFSCPIQPPSVCSLVRSRAGSDSDRHIWKCVRHIWKCVDSAVEACWPLRRIHRLAGYGHAGFCQN